MTEIQPDFAVIEKTATTIKPSLLYYSCQSPQFLSFFRIER